MVTYLCVVSMWSAVDMTLRTKFLSTILKSHAQRECGTQEARHARHMDMNPCTVTDTAHKQFAFRALHQDRGSSAKNMVVDTQKLSVVSTPSNPQGALSLAGVKIRVTEAHGPVWSNHRHPHNFPHESSFSKTSIESGSNEFGIHFFDPSLHSERISILFVVPPARSEMILASPFPERHMGNTFLIRRLIWTGVRILEPMIHQLPSEFLSHTLRSINSLPPSFESPHARNGRVSLRELCFFATVRTVEFVLANRLMEECVQSTDFPDIAGIDGPACQMPAASPSKKKLRAKRDQAI